jgi:O-acetyl-ADP-ribose deacetylase (regulator of RNase III)
MDYGAKGGTVTFVRGSILDATEEYICHQCNCTSRGASGLAKAVFRRFPWANVYNLDRTGMLGKIIVSESPNDDGPSVVHMMAQYRPLRAKDKDRGAMCREGLFVQCLNEVAAIEGITSAAFPKGIGCGLAGGNWDNYLRYITAFAKDNDIQVSIYVNT